MDPSSVLLIVFLLICIALSAFFSGSETAYTTANKLRLKNMGETSKKARRAYKIAEDYDRTISTVLVGNNIVNLSASSIGTVLFTTWFGASGAVLSTAVITVVVLIFGEVLPKTLAKVNPDGFAQSVSGIIRFLTVLFTPVTVVLMGIQKLAKKAVPGPANEPKVTEEELKYIIEESESEGVLEKQESDLVQSALDFDETTVEDILTPRVDVIGAEETDSNEEIEKLFFQYGYSRLPIYRDSIDDIIGILYFKDFFRAYRGRANVDIHSLMQQPLFVPPTKRISELLREIQHTKKHLVVVTDQYGGTLGIVTLEDMLEELVGDIWDESDVVEHQCIQLEDNLYQVSGDIAPEDFFELAGLDAKEIGFTCEAASMGGWALEELERIPANGDTFTACRMEVTISQIKSQRIEKMLVAVLPEPPKEEEEKSLAGKALDLLTGEDRDKKAEKEKAKEAKEKEKQEKEKTREREKQEKAKEKAGEDRAQDSDASPAEEKEKEQV